MQISEADYNLDAPHPVPTSLVTVTGAPVTVEVVQTELARISRIDWQWEAFPQGQDSFLVAFPSEEALNSMVDIGYQLKNHGVTLTISVWQQDQDIIPAYELDEVWVHITGVPPSYRHYLVFWALGTVIGATLDVDMLTYRKTGVIRVKVGILNKGQLPLTTNMVFGKVGYNVTYMLEDDSFQPAIVLANTFDPMDHDAGADKGNEDNEDGGSAAKKRRNEAAQPDASIPQAGNSYGPAPMQLALTPLGKNRPCPPWKPLKIMNETDKLPWIAVTRPKNGFHPSVGSAPTLSDTGAPLIKSNNGSALAAADDQIMAMQRAHTAAAGNNEKVRESSTQGLQMQHSVALSDDEIPTGEDIFSTPGAMKADVASPAAAVRRAVQQLDSAGSLQGAPSSNLPGSNSPLVPRGSSEMISPSSSKTERMTTPADELIMEKAMRRTASKNMIGATTPSSTSPAGMPPGYLQNYALASYMGYPTKAYFPGGVCCGLSAVGASGKGFFLPRHMDGVLVSGSKVITVSVKPKI
ncbi:hypothetical protein PVAP13_9NG752108 [Panicum virgatum]|uniref:DUF4283 domain-containing protein n=1 Tax=Panicum virgatum TaxID=38727 RepID=A0A8T0N925_PANVG|nr:hypothetical protein PVAP13_9NG752108 [Panicum virgatum]